MLILFFRKTVFGWLLLISQVSAAEDFSSEWSGNRVWIGPDYWANPLQDWRVEDGEVFGLAGKNRTLHHLTRQITDGVGDFDIQVEVRLNASEMSTGTTDLLGGFRVGIQGALDDYRYRLVHGTGGLDVGVRGDGTVVCSGKKSKMRINPTEWIRLRFQGRFEGVTAALSLTAESADGSPPVSVDSSIASHALIGNVALLAHGAMEKVDRDEGAAWSFRNWSLSGSALGGDRSQGFGPILWTQYTLSRGVMKMAALMAPVDVSDSRLRLELSTEQGWKEAAISGIDPLSRTAQFRLEDWDDSVDVPYRVVYDWGGEDHQWSGVIRRDPRGGDSFEVGAFSCDNGYLFPNGTITRNVSIQDPDLLFFAGDQIYESYGGFGTARAPVEVAMLDYLRKYWMFGWSWRELLKDRPSVILPDDHDVFQGNIWGHGGRRLPGADTPSLRYDWTQGGYVMDPAWVNAVQRTQTAHLPDAIDPEPVDQGIQVYFTAMNYGGVSFAILEDRKFKSGPRSVSDEIDAPAPELLGVRQETFLRRWMEGAGDADFRVVLSQTIFCKVTTHSGRQLKPSLNGFDSNGWPQDKRNRALRILGPDVVMVHGDQHLGALVAQGIDDWEDGPIGFMVPGTANGFPRAWWPDVPGANRAVGEPEWTGRYLDSLGNRMTVLAAGNPEKGSNEIAKGTIDPRELGHLKGSGHGVLKFHRSRREVTFELWRLKFDAGAPRSADQFEGFPKTLRLSVE